ncbi:MAG: hypothetical protein ACMVO3_05255 [Thalassobaculum sp.]
MPELFGGGAQALRLANPIMRRSRRDAPVDPAEPAGRRARATPIVGHGDVALFEVGPEYAGDRRRTRPGRRPAHAGRHAPAPRHWAGSAARRRCLFDAKADALGRAGSCWRRRSPTSRSRPTHPTGTTRAAPAACVSGRRCMARFGEIHPRILAAFDLKGPAVAFEVLRRCRADAQAQGRAQRPLLERIPFQPLARDFAFVVAC